MLYRLSLLVSWVLNILIIMAVGSSSLYAQEGSMAEQLDSPASRDQVNTLFQNGAYLWQALPFAAPSPENNSFTQTKADLGEKLFFDKRLSADGSVSCASCHELSSEKGGGDGRNLSVGIHNQQGSRNAPSVFNAAFQKVLFWDGRAKSLEEQAKGPLVNPLEMGMPTLAAVEKVVQGVREYRLMFADEFSEQPAVTIDNIAKAIAAYERTLITPNTPYDRFVRGDAAALSTRQLRGMELFEASGCVLCHSGPNFSGASIFAGNTPYRIFPAVNNEEFEARYQLTDDLGAAEQFSSMKRGVWRIPSLRNVAQTAPYFHNGSVDSLEEAVRMMANMQLNKKLSNRQPDDKSIFWSEGQKLIVANNQALSDDEVLDIVEFLKALSGTPVRSQLIGSARVSELNKRQIR